MFKLNLVFGFRLVGANKLNKMIQMYYINMSGYSLTKSLYRVEEVPVVSLGGAQFYLYNWVYILGNLFQYTSSIWF